MVELLGQEAERAFASLVEDAPVGADQVEAVRPATVRSRDRVIHAINECQHPQLQLRRAAGGNRSPLVVGRRLVNRDAGAAVLGQDPAFLRVRLAYVDRHEAHAVAVARGELLERPNLGAKGRSGIRAEHERDRLLGKQRREPNGAATVEAR